MRKVGLTIQDIIERIKNIQGQDIHLEITRGRKKTVKYTGVIENIYPSIFTVKSNENLNSFSYSYADVLCGAVNLIHNNKEIVEQEKSG